MLNIDGYVNSASTVYRLAKPYLVDMEVSRFQDLKPALLRFYEYYLPSLPVDWSENVFITDQCVEDRLAGAFASSKLDDLNQDKTLGPAYGLIEKAAKIELARTALHRLFDASPMVEAVFSTVIHSVFFRQNNPDSLPSAAGSTSGALGVIWLSGANDLVVDDYMELFVHELTHHLIFIDELNVAQFDYRTIADERFFSRSAILRLDRPIDKVLHSVIVAAELVASRRTFLSESATVHPSTATIVAETIASCEALLEMEDIDMVLHPRGRELVERCFQVCSDAVENPVTSDAVGIERSVKGV